MRPRGISIELTEGGLLIYRQRIGRLRARTPAVVESVDVGVDLKAEPYHLPDVLKPFKKFGLKIDFTIGTHKRPIAKWWKKPRPNPWTSGDHWFTLHIPFMVSCFLSVGFVRGSSRPGFYIGCKTYRVQDDNSAWCDPAEIGNTYICWSFKRSKNY